MASKTSRQISNFAKLIRNSQVHDNIEKGTLSVPLNSHSAEVQYERNGDIYNLVHTDIPEQYQGHGLGSILAEKVFDYLIQRNKKVTLSCEFLYHYYEKNSDKYKGFVVD